MITNDIPNGSILINKITLQPLLILKLTTSAKWAYNLNSNCCWANPTDNWIISNWSTDHASYKHISKAKLMLKSLFDIKQVSNLDYIEALAKLNEYAKEKA